MPSTGARVAEDKDAAIHEARKAAKPARCAAKPNGRAAHDTSMPLKGARRYEKHPGLAT